MLFASRISFSTPVSVRGISIPANDRNSLLVMPAVRAVGFLASVGAFSSSAPAASGNRFPRSGTIFLAPSATLLEKPRAGISSGGTMGTSIASPAGVPSADSAVPGASRSKISSTNGMAGVSMVSASFLKIVTGGAVGFPADGTGVVPSGIGDLAIFSTRRMASLPAEKALVIGERMPLGFSPPPVGCAGSAVEPKTGSMASDSCQGRVISALGAGGAG